MPKAEIRDRFEQFGQGRVGCTELSSGRSRAGLTTKGPGRICARRAHDERRHPGRHRTPTGRRRTRRLRCGEQHRHRRRPRAILIGDEIFTKVGAYILGNLLISAITAALTFIWLLIFDVPYPLLLALLVAFLDLIPIVGSTIAGIIVAMVALTVSVPVTIATVVFFIALRLIEDYLLVPRIIGRAVRVPALVTVVAVLLGAALWGMIGALLAIPVAAAALLIFVEIALPSLDGTTHRTPAT